MRAASVSPPASNRASPVRISSPVRSSSTTLQLPLYGDRSKAASPYNAATLLKRVPRTFTVDYSYKDLSSLESILREPPRSGVAYKKKEIAEEGEVRTKDSAASPSPAQQLGEVLKQQVRNTEALYTFGENKKLTGKTQVTDDGVVVIKAKDENYAFKQADQGVYNRDKDMKNWVMDEHGNLVRRKLTQKEEQDLLESKRTLYRCTALKCNNNALTALDGLEKALHLTLYRPHSSLSMLDFSCNHISTIPADFGTKYPVHTLLLHGNQIASIEEVKKLRSLGDTLRTLTLFDNPIQPLLGKRYRMTVLCTLPFITSLDDVRVTPTDRSKLETFAGVLAPRKDRQWLQKLLHTSSTSSSSSQGATTLPPIS